MDLLAAAPLPVSETGVQWREISSNFLSSGDNELTTPSIDPAVPSLGATSWSAEGEDVAAGWSTHETIIGNPASSTAFSITGGAHGDWHAVYSDISDDTYFIRYRNSNSDDYPLAQASEGAWVDDPKIDMGSDGKLHVSYRYVEGTSQSIKYRSTSSGSGLWSSPETIVANAVRSAPFSITGGAHGSWHLVYLDHSDGKSFIRYKNSNSEEYPLAQASGGWSPGASAWVDDPKIDTGPDGKLHVSYRYGEGFSDSIKYRSKSSGSGFWSTPETIIDDPVFSTPGWTYIYSITGGAHGDWHAVYTDWLSAGTDTTHFIRYKNSNSAGYPLAQATGSSGGAGGALVRDPKIDMGPDGKLHVAYFYSDGTNQSIKYTSKIQLDVAVTSATTIDSRQVVAEIVVSGGPVEELQLRVYRSTEAEFPSSDAVPWRDLPPINNLPIGVHPTTLAVDLPPDPERPYVFVVADPEGQIEEADERNNSAHFRKYVLGALTHGYSFWGSLTDWNRVWVHDMADALQGLGYSTTRFNWLARSNDPSPGHTQEAGRNMATQVINAANGLVTLWEDSGLPLAPEDAIDLHMIGHSRGAVVISEAYRNVFDSVLSDTVPPQLKRGYVVMTMLDPHPARNRPNTEPSVWCSYDPGVWWNPFTWLGRLKLRAVEWFQARAQDPTPIAHPSVHETVSFFQTTEYSKTPLGSGERTLNLWGETIPGATKEADWTTRTDADPPTGHTEVHERYFKEMILPYLLDQSGGSGEGAEEGPSDVDSFYPEFVDDPSVADALVELLEGALVAYESETPEASLSIFEELVQTIEAEQQHIESGFAESLKADAQLLIDAIYSGGSIPPLAYDDLVATAAIDVPVVVDILTNDVDADGSLDPGSVAIVEPPENGGFDVNPDGTVTYTPTNGFNGVDFFRYEVRDGDGAVSNTAEVTVLVSSVDEPPLVQFTTARQSGAEDGGPMTVVARLSKPSNQEVVVPFIVGGDAVSEEDYTITTSPLTIPAGATTGTITITPNNDAVFYGSKEVTLVMEAPIGAALGTTTVHTATIVDRYSVDRRYPWQRPGIPEDVDNDGQAAPLDVLIVINELNRPQYVDDDSRLPPPHPDDPYYFDVNGDGYATPIDVLQVINYLNAAAHGEGESGESSLPYLPGVLCHSADEPSSAFAMSSIKLSPGLTTGVASTRADTSDLRSAREERVIRVPSPNVDTGLRTSRSDAGMRDVTAGSLWNDGALQDLDAVLAEWDNFWLNIADEMDIV